MRESNDQYNNNNRFNTRAANENVAEQFDQRQYNKNYESSNGQQQQEQYGLNNQLAPGGITKTIVDKIVAIQKITTDRSAKNINNLNRNLVINKDIIKLSAQHFVTFYNATMRNLEAGQLESLYINNDQDVMTAKYNFDQLKTVGSFKSNNPNFRSGRYTIILKKVNSTVRGGLGHDLHRPVIEPAKFQDAYANITTEDGIEVEAFNEALEHRYLRVLGNAVSNEVLMSTGSGIIGQLKNEIRKPVAIARNAETKLFDMKWTEDDVTMEMPNVGFSDVPAADQQTALTFDSMTFQHKSEDTYSVRCAFGLTNLKWSSVLNIESAGTRMNTSPANFNVNKVDVSVTILKLLNQQQQQPNSRCANIDAEVDITGFRYDFDDFEAAAPSELLTVAKNKLQRFMKYSLESHFKNSMMQVICDPKNNF